MFALGRKRPREEQIIKERAIKTEEYNDDDEEEDLPLDGVVACLSGFDQTKKEDLHQLVLDLGGKYTRELNLDKNTHLITDTAQGAKFDLAASSNPPVIHIVTASWVNSTAETGRRAREEDHNLLESTTIHDDGFRSTVSFANDALLQGGHNCSRSFLFQSHQFYLMGFDGNPDLKQSVSKLIRRGNGTIYWDLNEDINILVVCDGCEDVLKKAATVISSQHSNAPPMVSPLWVVESYKRGTLQPSSTYPPGESSESNDRKLTTKVVKKQKTSLSSTTSNVSIFRGCLFSLVTSSTRIEQGQTTTKPSDNDNDNIEFDEKELEALIKAHGGQVLSNKLVGALRADAENTKRKVFVLCWGESPPRLNSNPIVSQIQRHNLCELILVTPVWLQACVSARKRIKPGNMPFVLQPQSWPMKKLSLPPNSRLDLALTGFQGTEKLVIVHLIHAMGCVYHDNMSNANTHLVFKKHNPNINTIKWKKAVEWGLHVVSIQWLYHILQHGYCGVHKEHGGCEERFSFKDKSS